MDLVKVFHNDSRSYSSEPFPYEVPIGSIIRWTGDRLAEPPKGTLFCDGTEVTIASYPELFEVVRYAYGEHTEGKFRLPLITGSVIVYSGYGEAKDGYDDVVDLSRFFEPVIISTETFKIWRSGNLVRVELELVDPRTNATIVTAIPTPVENSVVQLTPASIATGEVAIINSDGDLIVSTAGYNRFTTMYFTEEEWV